MYQQGWPTPRTGARLRRLNGRTTSKDARCGETARPAAALPSGRCPTFLDPAPARRDAAQPIRRVADVRYSSTDGFRQRLARRAPRSRAVGGAALGSPRRSRSPPKGRISPQDLGIWKDEHVAELARIARFCAGQGAAWELS